MQHPSAATMPWSARAFPALGLLFYALASSAGLRWVDRTTHTPLTRSVRRIASAGRRPAIWRTPYRAVDHYAGAPGSAGAVLGAGARAALRRANIQRP